MSAEENKALARRVNDLESCSSFDALGLLMQLGVLPVPQR